MDGIESQQQNQNELQDPQEKLVPQSQINKIVQERLSREREKYSDYEELRKFKQQYEEQTQQAQQKKLEEQQQYEQLKQSWQEKENQYKSLLSEKDQRIQEVTITNSLSTEVLKNNAYPDAIELLKQQAVVKDGKVFIRGTDANGISQELSLQEGVKQFLSDRPYLVKAGNSSGSGTPPMQGGNNSTEPRNLAQELQVAMNSGDRARVQKIKQEIAQRHSQMGILR